MRICESKDLKKQSRNEIFTCQLHSKCFCRTRSLISLFVQIVSSEVWSEVIDQHPVLCHLTFKSAKCRVIAQGKVFAGQCYPSAGAQLLVHSCWCWKYDWMTVISYIEIYWNVSLNIFRQPEASQNSKYVVLLEFWPSFPGHRSVFLKTFLIGEICQKFKSCWCWIPTLASHGMRLRWERATPWHHGWPPLYPLVI